MAIVLERAEALAAIPWLRHGFSTSVGGASTIYGGHSLNLGWTQEDDPANVRENRASFVRAVTGEGEPMLLVTVRQTHSAAICEAGPEALEGRLEMDGKAVIEGDGLITDVPGLLVAAGTADCVPVLVADRQRRVVGAFHAGWRGTAAAIVEKGVQRMRDRYGSDPEDLVAAIGPSIASCCYVVGEEVRAGFVGNFPYGADLFREEAGQGEGSRVLHVDLWEANRRQLVSAGIPPNQISLIGECTSCRRFPDGVRKYFSHRAQHGHAGRMLNAIGIFQAKA